MTVRPRVPLVWVIAAVLIGAGCESGTAARPDAAAMAVGYSTRDLAAGKLSSLPTGNLYIRVIDFAQPPGHSFPSRTHQPGFVYITGGVQRLMMTDRTPLDLAAGQALFQPSVAHVHSNPGSTTNHWFFIALWPAESRADALVDPSASVAYATPDLPPATLPQGSYVQTLRLVELEPGGRSVARWHGGIEVSFVLEGSISAHVAGQAPSGLSSGQGTYHLPGAQLQEHNSGTGPARFLEVLTTAEGKPFQTSADHAP